MILTDTALKTAAAKAEAACDARSATLPETLWGVAPEAAPEPKPKARRTLAAE